jgi:hypothetical protein
MVSAGASTSALITRMLHQYLLSEQGTRSTCGIFSIFLRNLRLRGGWRGRRWEVCRRDLAAPQELPMDGSLFDGRRIS